MKMYYPEAPPPSNFQKSLYNKTKEHLKKLSDINQKKKEEEIERRVKEQEDEMKRQRITDQVLKRMAAEHIGKGGKPFT